MIADIYTINRATRTVMLEDGMLLRIVSFYDGFGDETDDVDDAVTCAAVADGVALAINLTAFNQPRVVH